MSAQSCLLSVVCWSAKCRTARKRRNAWARLVQLNFVPNSSAPATECELHSSQERKERKATLSRPYRAHSALYQLGRIHNLLRTGHHTNLLKPHLHIPQLYSHAQQSFSTSGRASTVCSVGLYCWLAPAPHTQVGCPRHILSNSIHHPHSTTMLPLGARAQGRSAQHTKKPCDGQGSFRQGV